MDEEIILEVGRPAPAAATWSRNKPPSRALPKSLTWTKIRHETKRLFQATRFSDSLLYSNRKLVHIFFLKLKRKVALIRGPGNGYIICGLQSGGSSQWPSPVLPRIGWHADPNGMLFLVFL